MPQSSLHNLEKRHPFRPWRRWNIPGTSWSIEGYSRSGDKTFFYIPQLNLCFDAALAEGRQADYVLITHTHNDHIADIEYLSNKDRAQLYVPYHSKKYVDDYIIARRALNHSAPYDPSLRTEHSVLGVKPGDHFYIGAKKNLKVEVVECFHSLECVGYALSSAKKRLKAQWISLQSEMTAAGKLADFGALMAQKRQEGEVLEEEYWEKTLAFLGDTETQVFEKNPGLFEYPVIFTECTFLLDADQDYAQERKHSHWQSLKPYVLANPNTQFVLTHFSLRYTETQILDFFEAEKQQEPSLKKNVLIWAHRESLLDSGRDSA